MAWATDDDVLACDTCPRVFHHPPPRRAGNEAARTKGWHIFQGESLTGRLLDVYLCPKCVGSGRSKPLPIARLREDEPLF